MPEKQTPVPSNQIAVVPSAAELAHYASINPDLPAKLLDLRNEQLRREFAYASLSLGAGLVALLVIVGGFVYLSMHGHPVTSSVLLGAGVLSLVTGIVRSRLNGQS